jgi:LysR family transcriptional activator of glutamate synthase operon
MSLTLSELEYFLITAQEENVSRAAARLHMTQPSLSRAIRALEDDLGVKLFDRTGRRIQLNAFGKIVQNHASIAIHQIESMKKELQDAQGIGDKTIIIRMTAGSTFMAPFLSQYKKVHPDIHYNLMQQSSKDPGGSKYDIYIFASPTPVENDTTAVLLEERMLMAMPETDPRATKKKVRLSDFSQDSFICMQKGTGLREVTDYYFEMAGISPTISMESDSPYTVREYIKTGVGVALVPEITWRDVKGNHVALVPVSSPSCRRYVCISWNKFNYHSELAENFRLFLVHRFETVAQKFLKQS